MEFSLANQWLSEREDARRRPHERFLYSGSPVDTRKPARMWTGEGFWWPLALDEIGEEAAQVVARLWCELVKAYTDRRDSQSVLDRGLTSFDAGNEFLYEMKVAWAEERIEHLTMMIEAAYVG